MQSVTPLANQSSFVTLVTPNIAGQWTPTPTFTLSLSYSTEIAIYHSASSEEYVAHRGTFNLGGKVKDTTWELLNGITWIEGNHQSLTFTGPGGAPALGGVPLRDRRAAAIYRESFKLQHSVGNWFLRPVASVYVHDFHTVQSAAAGYQNYADRSDVNGGLDVGYKAFKDACIVLGYRHGSQEQSTVLTSPIEYGNTYERFLAGIEGKPAKWLKWSLMIGPDYRSFGPNIAAGFDRHKTKVFLDFTATLTPAKAETITLIAKRFEQPGYGGKSVYEDSTYEVSWRHKFNDKFSASLGARALNWNFELPVKRDEWWYSGNASATYALSKHLAAELSYTYDQIESLIPNTAGREAKRHLVSLGVKYVF
ncbi:MAG: outer membrane beta-barrel protein [Verrucomicrobia bacterium]|nr:outer membrane beta-barrel protein [Verrucomicrobiota bacterium]